MAGPRRPQDRVALGDVCSRSSAPPTRRTSASDGDADDEQASRTAGWRGRRPGDQPTAAPIARVGHDSSVEVRSRSAAQTSLHHGSVAIAAITSCTNTSNPSVMVGAGLLAQEGGRARAGRRRRMSRRAWRPARRSSRATSSKAGLLPYLEALGFHIVGYGCTTCIGNSAARCRRRSPRRSRSNDLVVAAVLSGNRNFEGRIHPQVRAAFLASPPLVVAYALAGTVDIDLQPRPARRTTRTASRSTCATSGRRRRRSRRRSPRRVDPSMFREEYATVFAGDERWQELPVPTGNLYEWDPDSTYVQEPPYFVDLAPEPGPLTDIAGRAGAGDARRLGDDRPHLAGRLDRARRARPASYLIEHGVEPHDFNSYGARRGNHEVMIRGTFANIRLRNLLVPGKEGNWTDPPADRRGDDDLRRGDALPGDGNAAGRDRRQGVRHRLLARLGGEGHAAARRARRSIAESFERIHRCNLVGMGVLPLQFLPGESAGVARPDRPRDVRHPRRRRRADAEGDADGRRRPATTARPSSSRRSPGSTARSRSTTTGTAASCRPCCAG